MHHKRVNLSLYVNKWIFIWSIVNLATMRCGFFQFVWQHIVALTIFLFHKFELVERCYSFPPRDANFLTWFPMNIILSLTKAFQYNKSTNAQKFIYKCLICWNEMNWNSTQPQFNKKITLKTMNWKRKT